MSPSPSTLVDNVLYWPSTYGRDNILQFDLDSQNLEVIRGPRCMNNRFIDHFQIIQAEDGVVGLIVLSCHNLQMWKRKVDSKGVAIWLRQKTVALRNILELPPKIRKSRELHGKFVGHDEDNNAVFLYIDGNVYMVQLKSMQSKKLKGIGSASYCYPFTSFYPPSECSSLIFIF
ncbi:unnamed protein product [Triticum turgidum subsp. durum]|uniref:F-box protein AT5G49610-like beta-propeller domain-containing protein n=1 Tax=Triticum turgidum subsp. durum TaxID=4567 RepID=A0A9R1Q5G8_TRITD|nr:unnamed protein product [Triticum turgidum subsp. durum]